MSTPNITRWIGAGLLGLPIYGVLTFWTSLHPQPDPNTHYEAWARFVTTNDYVLEHLLGTSLGTILAILGVVALGTYLARSSAGRMGLVAMVITVVGEGLFLTWAGTSTFSAPAEGQVYLAGMEEFAQRSPTFADSAQGVTILVAILLNFVGNLLLGVAVWRSGRLPRWAGVLWVAAVVMLYPLGLMYAMISGVQSTPRTVLVGALLIAISGAWMAWNVLRRPSFAEAVGVGAQARVQ
jgi:hypothetical protein